jgi:hypothetical protein
MFHNVFRFDEENTHNHGWSHNELHNVARAVRWGNIIILVHGVLFANH